MILYRIQHRQTKKFFGGIKWYDTGEIWSKLGTFFRSIDSVIDHLNNLCRVERQRMPNRGKGYRVREALYDKKRVKKLKLYRVVINDVTIMGEKRIAAEKFITKKSKEKKISVKIK